MEGYSLQCIFAKRETIEIVTLENSKCNYRDSFNLPELSVELLHGYVNGDKQQEKWNKITKESQREKKRRD